MRRLAIAALLGTFLAVTAACGPQSEPATIPVPRHSATKPAGAVIVEPGRVGPFVVGKTSKQLLDAGLVQKPKGTGCPTLEAVGKFKGTGLQFDNDNADSPLVAILIKSKGPRTAEGVQVGDTVEHLKATYGDKLAKHTGVYGETTYVVTDGTKAIGFGTTGAKIEAIEVFEGPEDPVWDGC